MLPLFLSYAAMFALVVSRVAGYVATAPFPGANVSASQRVGLLFVLSWVATTFAPIAQVPPALGPRLVLAAIVDLGCGAVVGLTFRFIFIVADTMGQVLSQAIGLASPSVLNPTLGVQDVILSRIVSACAMLVALGAGVHRLAIGYLLESFRALPVGTALTFSATSRPMIDLALASFALGVRLALPVVALAIAVHFALALIARAAPSLQLFSVGFAVLLATGFLAVTTCIGDMVTGVAEHLASLPRWLDLVLTELAGGGT